jgi:hypothetical protein
MSDFGMFEADEAAANEPRRQARTAARKLDAAIDTVRANFGRFLLGATGIDEFEDRWHLSKNDIRASVEPMVFPNTGTMRRIQNAMKADWKIAHPYKLAMDHDEAGYGQMETDNTRSNQDLDETYHPSSGNLIPKDDFEGWKDSVDQDGPEKVSDHVFTPGGDSGSDKHARRRQATEWKKVNNDGYPAGADGGNMTKAERDKYNAEEDEKHGLNHESRIDREAAMLVADIYTDFAQSNGLRVASMRSLDAYASTGIAESDYRILANLIRIAEEKAEDCDSDEDEDADSEAPEASESDDSDSDDDEGDDYDFGGEDAAEDDTEADTDEDGDHDDDDHHDFEDTDDDGDHDDDDHHDDGEDYDFGGGDDGGDVSQTFTVPDQAPELDPQMLNEIPHDNPQGAAPVPPEVIDSLLGLPEGTIEQLLLEEVEQGQGGGDMGMSGGAPQGGGDDFLGEGGDDADQEPPRVARRSNSDYGRPPQGGGIPKRFNDNYYSTDPDQLRREMEDDERTGQMETERERKESRRRQANTNPLDVECPDCGADQGEPCLVPADQLDGGPHHGQGFHENRSDPEWHQEYFSRFRLNRNDGSRQYNSSRRQARRFWAEEGSSTGPTHVPVGGSVSPSGGESYVFDGPAMQLAQPSTSAPSGGSDPDAFAPADTLGVSPHNMQRALAARSFWAAEGDEQESEGGGGEQQAAPAQDPAAAMGGMQQPMMPPPGSGAVAPPAPPQQLENQPAEDALLDTANQAIMQMIDQETAEYQQIIDPLSQALQAIQFAQQVEQSEHPMDVTPPEGTVNVDPSAAPGGAQAMQQQARRRRMAGHPEEDEDYWPHSNAPDHVRMRKELNENNRRIEREMAQDGRRGKPTPDMPERFSNSRQAKVEFGIHSAAKLIAARYRLSATGHQMLLNAALGRRGYEHVVEALKLVPAEVRQAAAIHMSHLFAAGNQRFNKDVFMKTVMASNPRDRAGDAWRDGRDRGEREHGRQDANDFGEYDRARPWIDDEDGGHFADEGDGYGRGGFQASRGRHPFDRPRLAGETWTNTPTKDAFEFPNAGEVARVDDNNDTNNLPPMKGADPHGKNAASEKAVDRFQRWQKSQQQRGLPTTQGESAVHNFLQTHNPIKKRVGPEASDMIHRDLGLNPDSVKTPRAKPVKAVNPTLKGKGGKTPAAPTAKTPAPKAAPKTASFFTRKVSGWRWDDHLNGYLSKEARAFTCACGQKIAAPSYKTCACGKVWNVYAIGDSHHLASDTASMYIAREIEVRPGVIMANRKMAVSHDYENDPDECGHNDEEILSDGSTIKCHECGKITDTGARGPGFLSDWEPEEDPFDPRQFGANRKQAKDGGCTCWEGYERVPGTEPCASGSCRKKSSKVYRENLAAIERLAADNSGSPYNPGAGSGVIPDTKYFPTNTPGAGGIGADRVNKGGQFNDGIKIDTSNVQIDEAPPMPDRTVGVGVDGFGKPDESAGGVGRMDSDNTLFGGGGSFGDASTATPQPPSGFNGTPSLLPGKTAYADNLAMIERLADWTKYDSPDPSRDPKAKPPSTKIKSQPGDWTNRDFTGPTKGQWREPDPTELPRKTRKKK